MSHFATNGYKMFHVVENVYKHSFHVNAYIMVGVLSHFRLQPTPVSPGCGHFVTGHFVTTISSHRHIVTRTFRHTDISSPDKTSHGHFVTGQNVTRTYRHMTFRHRTFRHNHFVTQTYRHTDISSHGHFVTGQNVTRTFRHRTKRHTDISSPDKTSHGHIVTGHFVTKTFRHTDILSQVFWLCFIPTA